DTSKREERPPCCPGKRTKISGSGERPRLNTKLSYEGGELDVTARACLRVIVLNAMHRADAARAGLRILLAAFCVSKEDLLRDWL
ncbi:hypothetical protein, partial [Streptomyces sp. NPDC005859]|uniref:hypothetical protein n=1 Tax=Streptomyces sp. NPDC005859 TaxID=3157170 RepID=UPI003404CE0B